MDEKYKGVSLNLKPFPMAESFNEEFQYQINQLARFTKHGPSIGRYVEILMLKLLRKYFPRKYDFSSGFYFSDIKGQKVVSSQLDIICFDRMNYPVLFDDNEYVIVPPCSVKAVIEMKSTMTSDSLAQIMEQSNCYAARCLPKETTFNLLSVKSAISPKTAFNYIKEFYGRDKDIVKGVGIIYSLDWDEIIFLDSRCDKYIMYRLNNFNLGLSSFVNQLIFNLYGVGTYLSTTNAIGPAIFIPIEEWKIR